MAGTFMLMQTELVWLLGAVAKGDEAAFERLYAATRAKLYGVLLRILGRAALADEVMQETYLKVWKMADQFDPQVASPITWMVAIARRENLKRSADELRIQLDDAKSALGEAFDELKKVELLDERDQAREREAEEAAEQAELDGIALLRMRGAAPA